MSQIPGLLRHLARPIAALAGTRDRTDKEPAMSAYAAALAERRTSVPVDVGGVTVGGSAPIVVQSMTNTDTADVDQTARQVEALARTGSELVRITVDRADAAAAV